MSRMGRGEVLDPNQVEVAHVYTRTVRRCFLFGDDPVSGKNFDHRKVWIENYLVHFAACFGIDLLTFSVMSNHFHLILRSRPDVVAAWDDTEVARRWLRICPQQKDSGGNPLEPTEPELNAIRNCPEKLKQIRSRLSDISWWMRLLCQRIAQRANREDEGSGRFFEDRFKSERLIDEASLLACAAYVDLNPIRAAVAETLEGSDHTSVQRRIEALREREKQKGAAASSGKSSGTPPAAGRGDAFLAPIELDERGGEVGVVRSRSGRRCSDKGFLWFSAERYLELLDWTARQVARDKPGKTPAHLAPILQRLGLKSSVWCQLVADFGELFHHVAGTPEHVDAQRSHRTHRRFHLKRPVRELFLAA